MKRYSRVQTLVNSVNSWLELPRVSRSSIAVDVVDAVSRIGLKNTLLEQGISFAQSDDPYNDSRVNAQKLFRWLGAYTECHTMPDKLFFVEQAIVAAMPSNIRVDYLNRIYSSADVCVSARQAADKVDSVEMATRLIKEQSEAQLAVVNLRDGESGEQLQLAINEVSEAVDAGSQVLETLIKRKASQH